MRTKVFSNPPADAFITAIMPYIVGGIALYLITRKAKSEIPQKIEEVKIAAAQIKAGLPGYVSDKVRGVNESTYVSQEQAKLDAAKALAAARAAKASVGTFSDLIYGI